MKYTNERKMADIGQPLEKRKMKAIDSFEVNTTKFDVYIDTEVPESDFYLCHKQIQDFLCVRHDAGILLKPAKKAKCLYPNVLYGKNIGSRYTTMHTFINFKAFTLMAKSLKLYPDLQNMKMYIFDAFKEYVDMHGKNNNPSAEEKEVPTMEEEETKAEHIEEIVEEIQDEKKEDTPDFHKAEEPIYIPECAVEIPFSQPFFQMFDDKPSIAKITSEMVVHAEEQVEQKDESELITSAIQDVINKALEPYKAQNRQLGEKINSLMHDIEELSAEKEILTKQNEYLNEKVRTCAVPNNIPTSKALYQLADSMQCYPIDVCNIVHNAIIAKGAMEYPSDKKYAKIWGKFNDKLKEKLINQGCDLTFFEVDQNHLKQTEEQKALRDKYGPMEIKDKLYAYMIKGLGYHKQALLILHQFMIEEFNDTTTIVDAVKRYFRIDNTNAAIHWLHRWGININYLDE